MSSCEHQWCWVLKLPDDTEHKFFYGPEDENPLLTVSGLDLGTHYMVQAPTLVDESGVLNQYAMTLSEAQASGITLPEFVSPTEPNCYVLDKNDVIQVSGWCAEP